MELLAKAHKHYGSLLLALAVAVVLLALTKGPKPAFQRIVAVLIDINLVVGLANWWVSQKAISLLHPLLALVAIGLAHASARSEDRSKVVRCWTLVVVALLAAWAVHATWGPAWLKGIWMVSLRGAPAA